MNIAIDFETSMLPYSFPWQPESFVVSLHTCDDNMERRTWFFDHEAATQSTRDAVEEITEYLSNYDRVIAHNLKFDMHWCRAIGLDLDGHLLWCTMVVEYLVRRHGNFQELSLDELSEYYGLPAKKDKVAMYWDAGINTDKIPAETLQVYGEQDAVNAMLIFKRQSSRVNKMGLNKLLSLEMSVIRCYADMEWNGMAIDLKLCKELDTQAEIELNEIDTEILELLGVDEITPTKLSLGLFGGTYEEEYYEPMQDADGNVVRFKSGQKKGEVRQQKFTREIHVEGLGFDPQKLGIPMTARHGIYSVSKEKTLPLLKPKTTEQKRVVELMRERSALSKLQSSYYASFPSLAIQGCVRSSINQALTKTGRLSSCQPNLQNIPRGSSPVKHLFVSRF